MIKVRTEKYYDDQKATVDDHPHLVGYGKSKEAALKDLIKTLKHQVKERLREADKLEDILNLAQNKLYNLEPTQYKR